MHVLCFLLLSTYGGFIVHDTKLTAIKTCPTQYSMEDYCLCLKPEFANTKIIEDKMKHFKLLSQFT